MFGYEHYVGHRTFTVFTLRMRLGTPKTFYTELNGVYILSGIITQHLFNNKHGYQYIVRQCYEALSKS